MHGFGRERPREGAAPGAATLAKLARVLLAGIALVVLGVMALAGWVVLDARQAAWRHAIQTSENIVAALNENIRHSIELYDLSLQGVIDGLRLPGVWALDPEIRNHTLFDRAAAAEHLGSMRILDAKGEVVVDSHSVVPRDGSFADRDYFIVHRDRPDVGLYLSPPFRSRDKAEWSIALSRRLETADGAFAGVVVGTLRLDYFAALFAPIDMGPSGAITLLRPEGTIVYREPHGMGEIGQDVSKAAIYRHFPTARAGHFAAPAATDGVKRLFVYAQVADLPLLLSVSTAVDTIFAEWRPKAIAIGGAVAGLAGIAIALAGVLLSELRRREEAEAAVLDSERRHRLLAEHSSDVIMRVSPGDLRVLYVSPACRRLYGYVPEELTGLPAAATIHPEDVEHFRAASQALLVEPSALVAYRHRRRDGGWVVVEASMRRANDEATSAPEIVAIVRDATERVRAEATLRAAKEQAEAASRTKSEFLANMSHELRTPMNAIIGFSEIIRDAVMGPVDARYRDYAQDIRGSAEHLLGLINNLLDIAKIEAGRIELQEEPVMLADIVEACRGLLAQRLAAGGVELVVELPPAMPPLSADALRLKQIVLNLMSNAVKFTQRGGRITVAAGARADGAWTLSVADTGIGMKPEEIPLALEPFRQLSSGHTRRYEGTGLGLPLALQLAELHGGSLEIASAPGKGTTVTLVLPASRVLRQVA